MRSKSIREKSLILRKNGYSYAFISEKTGISKSTLSDWLHSIDYHPNQEMIDKIGKARAASGRAKHLQKIKTIEEAGNIAISDVGALNQRDLFMLGIGLYIGEGSKTHNNIRVINSNPEIIKLAIKWFMSVCGLKIENFSILIHTYPDNDIDKSLRYWSDKTGVPISQFSKTHIDYRMDKKSFKYGKLPYGTAHLSVRSRGNKEFGVRLSRRILAWIEIVLHYY
ncbi:MAG TPA: helix-turn-helix transcriptional regulator [Candidatus Paceibacterota bacterium]